MKSAVVSIAFALALTASAADVVAPREIVSEPREAQHLREGQDVSKKEWGLWGLGFGGCGLGCGLGWGGWGGWGGCGGCF